MELTQYNIVDGKHSYLSIGDTPLPILFGVFSGVYGLLLLLWIFRYLRGQGRMINKIHYLMTVLVVFKCLSLFFQSVCYLTSRSRYSSTVGIYSYSRYRRAQGVEHCLLHFCLVRLRHLRLPLTHQRQGSHVIRRNPPHGLRLGFNETIPERQ